MAGWKSLLLAAAVSAVAVFLLIRWRGSESEDRSATAAGPMSVDGGTSDRTEISMAELLELAADAHSHVVASVDDYTARFVKQETDRRGKLGAKTEMAMKVQTAHRGGEVGTPMRVYLKFLSPDDVAGREVIWSADRYDGKLVVHEAGILGNVPIPPLDPEGMIAMRGQRYPIYEIGLTKLLEKLIVRGEPDRDDPSIRVTIDYDQRLDDRPVWLIRIRRHSPALGENNFSLAEILFDPERKLVLRYRSFAWPENDTTDTPPLIESYTYHEVMTNVGLTDRDFDRENPEYGFP